MGNENADNSARIEHQTRRALCQPRPPMGVPAPGLLEPTQLPRWVAVRKVSVTFYIERVSFARHIVR